MFKTVIMRSKRYTDRTDRIALNGQSSPSFDQILKFVWLTITLCWNVSGHFSVHRFTQCRILLEFSSIIFFQSEINGGIRIGSNVGASMIWQK